MLGLRISALYTRKSNLLTIFVFKHMKIVTLTIYMTLKLEKEGFIYILIQYLLFLLHQ